MLLTYADASSPSSLSPLRRPIPRKLPAHGNSARAFRSVAMPNKTSALWRLRLYKNSLSRQRPDQISISDISSVSPVLPSNFFALYLESRAASIRSSNHVSRQARCPNQSRNRSDSPRTPCIVEGSNGPAAKTLPPRRGPKAGPSCHWAPSQGRQLWRDILTEIAKTESRGSTTAALQFHAPGPRFFLASLC